MSSDRPKYRAPSDSAQWQIEQELSGSEDVSFDDLPHVGAQGPSGQPTIADGDPRTNFRVRAKTLAPEVAGWPPAPGAILLGKYRVERVLGKGGMGVVVVAQHLQLKQRVAIKFLHPSAMEDADVVARFHREGRVLAQIQSEHVVRILDVGALDGGEPFMVMEYLEGTDLSRAVKDRGPLPVAEAVDYLVQACEPLAEAHLRSIVHRDLKPSNLYLARRADGSLILKVIDFGISKVESETELSMTKTSVVLGSPLYISPEQLRSAREADARSDIWALGVILYKLLSGHPPFVADSFAQLCAMILVNEPRPLLDLRPDVPDGLDEVILRCMTKDPAGRFQSVGQLAEALVPFLAPGAEAFDALTRIRRIDRAHHGTPSNATQESSSSLPPPPASPPSAGPPPWGPNTVTDGAAALTLGSSSDTFLADLDRRRRRKAMLIGIVVGLAGVALATVVAFVVDRPPPRVVAAPPPPPTELAAPAVPPPPPETTASTEALPPSTSTSPASSQAAGKPAPAPPPPQKKPAVHPAAAPPPPKPAAKPVDNADFGERK